MLYVIDYVFEGHDGTVEEMAGASTERAVLQVVTAGADGQNVPSGEEKLHRKVGRSEDRGSKKDKYGGGGGGGGERRKRTSKGGKETVSTSQEGRMRARVRNLKDKGTCTCMHEKDRVSKGERELQLTFFHQVVMLDSE